MVLGTELLALSSLRYVTASVTETVTVSCLKNLHLVSTEFAVRYIGIRLFIFGILIWRLGFETRPHFSGIVPGLGSRALH